MPISQYIVLLQLSSDSYYVIKVCCLVRFRAITCVSSIPDICVLCQLAHYQDYSSLSNMSKYQTYYKGCIWVVIVDNVGVFY